AGDPVDGRTLLALAAEIEGHPDNAAAALLGGLAVVGIVEGRPEALRIEPPRALRCVLFVPELPLETKAMRAALPHQVPLRDAAFNVGRAALTVAAFATNRSDLLRASTEDRLHQPYRTAFFPELPALIAAALEAGALGAYLSGAGSTVLAFADSAPIIDRVAAALVDVAGRDGLAGTVRIVAPRSAGAIVIDAA
ncbi:MAG TPA: hypothetical protein VFK38_08050, partial [Candidatus Limnocylindrales bacterium]|nr:hypothetical protein [Candidatus Limnocylindrales bacterium]